MSINGNIIFSNTPDPSAATLLVVDVGAGINQTPVELFDGRISGWSLAGRTINFNSTAVGDPEAALIAQKVRWMLVTGATSTYTAPVSGITVTGNGIGLGATVGGVSLTQAQAQQFAQAVGVWASTTPY